MKNCMRPIGCALLILALLLSLPGLALAAAEPGVYTLTTDKGGSREPVYGEATLTVAADGAMTLELLIKSSMSGIKYLDEELSAGEAVTIDEVEYVPYTLSLAAPTDRLELSAYVAAMGRDVSLTVGLSGWENVPGAEVPAEEPPTGEVPAEEGVGAGEYPITVANASTSPYGATTVYPEATLTVAEDGSCRITIYLKDSIANIRLEDGTSVPAGEAKTLSMNDEEGTYYPYVFPIAMRQAALTITDDVPAMSGVESMNYGKDMSTTINIDWTGTQGLVTALADGDYELPVALSSSMLSLAGLAQLTVSGGKYELTISVPEGLISEVRYGEDEIAPMRNDCNLDRFTLTLTEEAGQIPVKVSVTKMKGTAMEVQSVVLMPDWTQAQPVTETEAPASDVYDGYEVTFLKADGSGFGMFTPQKGTTAALKGEMVVIHYVPKNTTVYNAIHWGTIEDAELTPDLVFNEDGSFDITFPKAMCGRLIPVAPIKVKDGGTTKEQYYLAIPAAEKLAPPQMEAASQKLLVYGTEQNVGVYKLDGSTYFRLRDIAALLTGTGAQFNVSYDEAGRTVVITAGEAYTVLNSDLQPLEDQSDTAVKSSQSIRINGEAAQLEAFNIGGYNYVKLSELGAKLGFSVGYDMAAGAVTIGG